MRIFTPPTGADIGHELPGHIAALVYHQAAGQAAGPVVRLPIWSWGESRSPGRWPYRVKFEHGPLVDAATVASPVVRTGRVVGFDHESVVRIRLDAGEDRALEAAGTQFEIAGGFCPGEPVSHQDLYRDAEAAWAALLNDWQRRFHIQLVNQARDAIASDVRAARLDETRLDALLTETFLGDEDKPGLFSRMLTDVVRPDTFAHVGVHQWVKTQLWRAASDAIDRATGRPRGARGVKSASETMTPEQFEAFTSKLGFGPKRVAASLNTDASCLAQPALLAGDESDDWHLPADPSAETEAMKRWRR